MIMIRNEITSIMLAALVAMVCLFAVAAPVSAGDDLKVTIYPRISSPGASPGYIFGLDYSGVHDIYIVDVTIPKEYAAMNPAWCDCSEIILTLWDSTGGIISQSTAFKKSGKWIVRVDDTDCCDGEYVQDIADCGEGDVINMCTGLAACLSLQMPTASTDGSVHIELGPLGPLTSGDSMTLEFASDCIKNPTTCECYEWFVTATDTMGNSYSGSDRVCIREPPIGEPPISVPLLSGIGIIVLAGMLAIVGVSQLAKRRRE